MLSARRSVAMKRQMIVFGLAAFAVLAFASISATLAAPGNIPFLQSTTESEPNNSLGEANPMGVPDYVIGEVRSAPVEDTIDYFRADTLIGHKYQASLTIDSPEALNLRMVLYDGDGRLVGNPSSASPTNTSLSWAANHTWHYIRVEAVTVNTTTVKIANYRLDVFEMAEPTNTSTPTTVPPWDDHEPDNNASEAVTKIVIPSVTLADLNFQPYPGGPVPDEDWFAVDVKQWDWYQATTSELNNVDTYMEIRRSDGSVESYNDDYGNTRASQIKWQASYNGNYYVRVTNIGGSSDSDDTYNLSIEELDATATPTKGPTSTPQPGATAIPGLDDFEPNFDFAHASTLAINVTYSANLIPWGGGTEDNDFYKIWIKPGLHFTCATSELGPGVDTNMIVYDGNHNAIGGNDDVTLGDYSSRFAYFSTYEGWLYVLVGTGGRLPITDVKSSDYKIRCEMQVPGQATATSTPEAGEAPPPPATPVPPAPTPLPPEELTVRPLTTPTPASAVTPAPRFIPITLLVYYDAKDDQQPGAGEGIAGISAQAYDAATNQLLAQGFTDEQGNLQFTVSAQGPVRVAVPFFGFSQLVAGEGASIYLRVPPQPLPGGAP
jgi:hypothetical protein